MIVSIVDLTLNRSKSAADACGVHWHAFLFYFFKRIVQIFVRKSFVSWKYSNICYKNFPLYIFTFIPLFEWFCNLQTGGAHGHELPAGGGHG
jgi:hypothetical protein